MGIEPTRPAWKAGILPLNYTRMDERILKRQPKYNSIKISQCQCLIQEKYCRFPGHKMFRIFHATKKGGRTLALLWYFILYSFLGFLLEVAFARITDHPKKDRKCFLLLPLCPVYGMGAILIRWLAGVGEGPLWVMAAGFLGAGTSELAMGLFYRHVLGVDFWDYSEQPLNLYGLVCLRFCLYWTVLALGVVYLIDPLVILLLARIPPALVPAAAVLLGADGVVSALALRRTGTTDVLKWYE